MKNLNINQYLILMFLVALLIAGCGGGGGGSEVSENVTETEVSENVTENKFSIPDTVREEFELDAYYQQWVDAGGLPVVSGENVSPYALAEAAYLIQQVIGHRPEVLQEMAEKKVRFAVLPYNGILAHIPEIDLDSFPDGQKVYYRNFRLSGQLVMGVGEEHLLNYPGDPFDQFYSGDHKLSPLIYILVKVMLKLKLFTFVPDFDNRLIAAYDEWREKYPNSNLSIINFWAISTRSWFSTYQDILKADLPELTTLLMDAYGDKDWRYTPVATRTDLPHLQGFDPQNSPTFEWLPEFFECDPNEDRCDEWVNLKQYDPSELSSLTRTPGNETDIIFINATSADIKTYWINDDGMEIEYFPLSRSGFRTQNSHAGHIWIIKNENGENLAVFQAQEKTGFAVYRESN